MVEEHEQPGGAATDVQPSEEEMRAAYEAELNRITSSELILQTAVSLLNIGGRRLGLAGESANRAADSSAAADGGRDLEQVRDAIDGVNGLLPILERRMPRELGPLRDAASQLKMAYAREAQSSANATSTAAQAPKPEQAQPAGEHEKSTEDDRQRGPGPAQASGRLWVPGR